MERDGAHPGLSMGRDALSVLLWVVPSHSPTDGLSGHFGGQFARWWVYVVYKALNLEIRGS